MNRVAFLILSVSLFSACSTYVPDRFVITEDEVIRTPEGIHESGPTTVNVIEQVYGRIVLPYQGVCRFSVNRRVLGVWGSNANSSGALFDGNYIITAAHNFYSPFYNRAKNFYWECGVGTLPQQSPQFASTQTVANRLLVHEGYKWKPFTRDVAFLKVCPQDGSPALPHRTFRLATSEELKTLRDGDHERPEIFVSGYPGGDGWNSETLALLRTKIRSFQPSMESEPARIEYDSADTRPGLSGGPVWMLTENREHVIIGTHVSGPGKKLNSTAYLLTKEMLEELRAWQAKHLLNDPCER